MSCYSHSFETGADLELETIRQYAMSLPQVTEEPHFKLTSFRVHGKIFATITADQRHVHIFADEEDRERALVLEPASYEKLWWGSKVMGLKAHYRQADPELLLELIRQSWRRKAPKKLLTIFDRDSPPANFQAME